MEINGTIKHMKDEKYMKKIFGTIIVCLFLVVVIFVEKNVFKGGKKREYVKSVEYYEENIENINIKEGNFQFLQVDEVVNKGRKSVGFCA